MASTGVRRPRAHQLLPKLRTLTSITDPVDESVIDTPEARDPPRQRELVHATNLVDDLAAQLLLAVVEITPEVGEARQFPHQLAYRRRRPLDQPLPVLRACGRRQISSWLSLIKQQRQLAEKFLLISAFHVFSELSATSPIFAAEGARRGCLRGPRASSLSRFFSRSDAALNCCCSTRT